MATSVDTYMDQTSTSTTRVRYHIVASLTRDSNSQVTLSYTVEGTTLGGSHFFNGDLTLNIGLSKSSYQTKEIKPFYEDWPAGTSKSVSGTIAFSSTTANSEVTLYLRVVSSQFDGGTMSWQSLSLTTPALLYTACSAPTTFTASPSLFENRVTLSWSGAAGGTNNAITGYQIQYGISSTGGSSSCSYTDLVSTNSSPYTRDLSSIARGNYVKFRIRTKGAAGGSYYSGWKETGYIRRIPYTAVSAPGNVHYVDLDTPLYESPLVISWQAASSGEGGNTVGGYEIQYQISDASRPPISTDWTTAIITDAGTRSYTFAASTTLVERGGHAQLRIRAKGSKSSSSASYDSDWVMLDSIRRNRIPVPPDVRFPSQPIVYDQSDEIAFTLNARNNDEYDGFMDIIGYEILYQFESVPGSGVYGEILSSKILSYPKRGTIPITLQPKTDLPNVPNHASVLIYAKTLDRFGQKSELSATAGQLQREDSTGIKYGAAGSWVKAELYYGEHGEWVQREVSVGYQGQWRDATEV